MPIVNRIDGSNEGIAIYHQMVPIVKSTIIFVFDK